MDKIMENSFKARLKTDEVQFGVWLDTTSAYLAEMAATCGYDWMVLDGEHSPNTIQTLLAQMQAVTAYESHPLIRVPEGEDYIIKLCLDIGAKSIMVPMIDTAQQAEAMIRAMHYPPKGVRGAGASVGRATRWNRAPGYIKDAEKSLCLILQAETPEAIKNAASIAALDGVDAIFIGPVDLATSMGFHGDFSRPEVQAEIEKGLKAARAAGKGAGIFALNPEFAEKCMGWGANMVAVACDALAYIEALEGKLNRFKPNRKRQNF